jgi:hypothetical protein
MKMNTTAKETGLGRSKFSLFAPNNGNAALMLQKDVAYLVAIRDAVPNPAHQSALSAA